MHIAAASADCKTVQTATLSTTALDHPEGLTYRRVNLRQREPLFLSRCHVLSGECTQGDRKRSKRSPLECMCSHVLPDMQWYHPRSGLPYTEHEAALVADGTLDALPDSDDEAVVPLVGASSEN